MSHTSSDKPSEWTSREVQVLDLLVSGKTNPEIAETLHISLSGAKWHVSEIISKLGVDSREEAADYWRGERGWPRRLWRQARAVQFSAPARWIAAGACGGALVGAVFAGIVIFRGAEPAPPMQATVSESTGPVFDPLAIARATLQQEAPAVASAVKAIEEQDRSAVGSRLGVQHVQCATPVGPKGDGRLACARWGVPESSFVDAFEADVEAGWYLTPAELNGTIADILNASPKLAFVARKPGEYFVYFTITPSTLDLGLGPDASENYDGVAFVVDDSGATPIRAIEPHSQQVPASIVEQADDWGGRGSVDYQILGLSSGVVAHSQQIRPQSFGQFQFAASGQGSATGQAPFFSASTFPRALAEVTSDAPARFTLVCGSTQTVVVDADGPIMAGTGVVIANTSGDGTQCAWDIQTTGSWSVQSD